MSEERLASALERASNAARRIEAAAASLTVAADTTDASGKAALRDAIAPILADLDAMIAEAEKDRG